MKRNLVTLIDEMLKQIPSNEEEFISQLQAAQESAAYSAPESMRLRWEVVVDVLEHYIPVDQDKTEWQKKVIAIWMGEPNGK